MPIVSSSQQYISTAAPLSTLSPTKKVFLVAGFIFCLLALAVFVVYKNTKVTKVNPDLNPEEEIKGLVRKKDYAKVLKFVEDNPNINIRECLDFALLFNNDAIANIFAGKISEVNELADSKYLAEAINRGFDRTAYTLIRRGVNPAANNGYHPNHQSIIHMAIEKQLVLTLSELIKNPNLYNKIYMDHSALEYAISQSSDDVAAKLVFAGASCKPTKSNSDPLIHLALNRRLTKTVFELAKDPNQREAKNLSGKSPLQCAVHSSFDEAAATLINAKANCDGNFSQTNDRKSIHRVVRESKQSMPLTIQALKQNKIRMSMEDYFYFEETDQIDWNDLSQEEKNTCLAISIDKGMSALTIKLLNLGADQKTPKKPPIFVAIESEDKDLFEVCLSSKSFDPSMTYLRKEKAVGEAAAVFSEFNRAYTPLEYARLYERTSFIDQLSKNLTA